jgi:hypothetical protein
MEGDAEAVRSVIIVRDEVRDLGAPMDFGPMFAAARGRGRIFPTEAAENSVKPDGRHSLDDDGYET